MDLHYLLELVWVDILFLHNFTCCPLRIAYCTYMAILLHMCDDYRSLITHYSTMLEVRRAVQDLFRGVEEQGQVLLRGDLMVCKLSHPKFNLRHCCNRELNIQALKGQQVML